MKCFSKCCIVIEIFLPAPDRGYVPEMNRPGYFRITEKHASCMWCTCKRQSIISAFHLNTACGRFRAAYIFTEIHDIYNIYCTHNETKFPHIIANFSRKKQESCYLSENHTIKDTTLDHCKHPRVRLRVSLLRGVHNSEICRHV